jgi:NitT/TauT family transport system substrate-binding protein
MSVGRKIFLSLCAWVIAVPASRRAERELGRSRERLHRRGQAQAERRLHPGDVSPRVPVTDYIEVLRGRRALHSPHVPGLPEIKEAIIANKMQGVHRGAHGDRTEGSGRAGFASYLGHRYGSAVVVHKDGPVKTFLDMKGRTIAVPSRFSDERLIVFRVMKKLGMKPTDLKIVEMALPDVAGALAAKAIDAFSMGEPFLAGRDGRLRARALSRARALARLHVVRPHRAEDVIAPRGPRPQTLVDGVARSPLARGRKPNRDHAADFVGRFYFNQNPKILRWALTNPLDRVMYTPLSPRKNDFDLVRDLMIETGVLDRKIEFEEYVDTRFAEGAKEQVAWKYEPGSGRAR